jgi:hypothetical protein
VEQAQDFYSSVALGNVCQNCDQSLYLFIGEVGML